MQQQVAPRSAFCRTKTRPTGTALTPAAIMWRMLGRLESLLASITILSEKTSTALQDAERRKTSSNLDPRDQKSMVGNEPIDEQE
jgi:hypothetical protein